jgi:hypothetical protein
MMTNQHCSLYRLIAGGAGEENNEFGLAKYFCSYLQVIFYMP